MSAPTPMSREEWVAALANLGDLFLRAGIAGATDDPDYESLKQAVSDNLCEQVQAIMALQAEVERLRDALEKYGRHDRQCQWNTSAMPICPCGFSDIEKARQPK